jgi:tetratricopeptide (TPR) repeat protein
MGAEGTDDESTEEIDLEALRRATSARSAPKPPPPSARHETISDAAGSSPLDALYQPSTSSVTGIFDPSKRPPHAASADATRSGFKPARAHDLGSATRLDVASPLLPAEDDLLAQTDEHAGLDHVGSPSGAPASVESLDSAELESVDDLSELDDGTDHTEATPRDLFDALPRFSLPSMGDAEVDAELLMEDDATQLVWQSDPVLATPPPAPSPPPEAPPSRAAPPTRRPTAAPPPSVFQPPVGNVAQGVVPAYAADPDREERRLIDEERFSELLDRYRGQLVDAETSTERAALFHCIASVYEHALGSPTDAFGPLVEAFDQKPGDRDVVASLERVAKTLGRVSELADHARRSLQTTQDHEARAAILGHLVYWYERILDRAQEASPFVSELLHIDKTHPVSLKQAAQVAAANGDAKTQRDLLLRALERTTRRDEKRNLHITLAGACAGTPEAARHYEAALANDPSCVVALQGLEHIGRAQEKHAQVEWALERQIEVAMTESERVDALLKLAELHESKYLKRESAAALLERVIESEPSNPAALQALERCYHALRNWPRLAGVLRARAENTYDRKQKVELLELAAEVLESKLGDFDAAVELHRDLLVVDPTHRRALGDLARLYEKLGDWANVATYKARLAELAPTKRQASQLLVQLGDFLAAPERDAIAARLQYERAIVVDPANAAAWEALQRAAAEAGDERRVIACLESRARAVDGPRQRAAVLVELALVHRSAGDADAAHEAFQAAIRSDPTNEQAAAAVLDAYAAEERWKEAFPLCELLVNAAIRDKDETALFARLRLATRAAAALGEAERAMTSALAALDARPEDPDAQADLVAVCSQCQGNAQVLARAEAWLLRIAETSAALPVEVVMRLAELQRERGDLEEATRILEELVRSEPEHPGAIKALSDAYLAASDYPRACKLRMDLARNATSVSARFALLVEVGEIWARHAHELEKAATVFEEARSLQPLDHWLLHTLMWLYGELDDWTRLSGVLESIAQIQESPERKAKSLFAIAQVLSEKLHDPVRAAEYLDQVLDVDKKRLDVFEKLVKTLTEAKDWHALERSYRRMLARIKDDPEPGLKFALFQQLGLIYRDRLEDASRAFEALDAAARLRPDDAGVRKMVTEILVVTDNVDNAVARTREAIARDPHDAELYGELYELFLRQHAFDKAWCAVDVLATLREPSPQQRQFHDDYAPMPLPKVPGQIVDQAWRSHILHRELDPTLTRLFALTMPAVARMRHAQLRPDQLVHAVGRPFTSSHSRLHDAIRATFKNASEILSLSCPDLLLGDPTSTVPFAPSLAPFGSILVSPSAVEARADALVYVIGKRLAEQRPELCARAFFPSVSDLTALLAAAVRLSRSEGAKDAASAALDASFAAVLLPNEREGIRSILMQATMEGGVVDVKRWSQLADLSSMRAGLLLCGRAEAAKKIILAERQSPADLPPREKIGALYQFATSDLYTDLRGAVGVAIEV